MATKTAARAADQRSTPVSTLTIDHVSRIEGHARITINLDDARARSATRSST